MSAGYEGSFEDPDFFESVMQYPEVHEPSIRERAGALVGRVATAVAEHTPVYLQAGLGFYSRRIPRQRDGQV